MGLRRKIVVLAFGVSTLPLGSLAQDPAPPNRDPKIDLTQTRQVQADAQIVSVVPGTETELHEGDMVQFAVTVHYSLVSVNSAVLAVYAERFADASHLCGDAAAHHTEGGTTVRLERGEGEVKVQFAWHESGMREVPLGKSSLAIGINLWTDDHGRPVKPKLRAFGTSFCRPVNP